MWPALGIRIPGIQLRILVAQDLHAVDPVDDLVMAVHLHLDGNPLVKR